MRLHHIAIETNNVPQSLEFYRDVIGFQLEQEITLMNENLIFLTLGETRLELAETLAVVDRPASHMHIAFEVGSMLPLVERFKEKGIAIVEGPYDLENGWKNVFVEGPSGEVIEFIEV